MKRNLEQEMYRIGMLCVRSCNGSGKASKAMTFGTSVGYNDREYAERYVERHYGNSWREEFESSGR